MSIPSRDCPCKNKFKWKLNSRLRSFMKNVCKWDVSRENSFTINSLMYSLLIYLHRNHCLYDESICLTRKLSAALKMPQHSVTTLYKIRKIVVRHLKGRLTSNDYIAGFLCMGDKSEDIEFITRHPYMIFYICEEGRNNEFTDVTLSPLQLYNYVMYNSKHGHLERSY